MKDDRIRVSIVCLTYNHNAFIRQALDGFIMQKTNFDFEVIIHDDASTDGTTDIIREYEKKYPKIIKAIYQKENLYSQGKSITSKFIWPKIKGEYVAYNEGDDYWTDPLKLQRQVDFLDAHPDYSICFHPVKVVYEDNSQQPYFFPKKKNWADNKNFTLKKLLQRNFIQTNSVMYRWCLKDNEHLFPKNIAPGDWFLHLLHAQQGKIGFIPEVMSVYRRHPNGIWWNAGKSNLFFIQHGEQHINFYKEVEKYFNVDKTEEKNELILNTLKAYLQYKKFNSLKRLYEKFPKEYLKATESFDYHDKNSKFYKKYLKYKKITAILVVIMMIYILFQYLTIH